MPLVKNSPRSLPSPLPYSAVRRPLVPPLRYIALVTEHKHYAEGSNRGTGGYDQLTNLSRELFTDRIRILGLLAEVYALLYAPSAYPLEVRLLEHRINGHLEYRVGGYLTE